MENRWFKNAVIYWVDVDTLRDGNGDGIGDFILAILPLSCRKRMIVAFA
jgi:hypothetical protein